MLVKATVIYVSLCFAFKKGFHCTVMSHHETRLITKKDFIVHVASKTKFSALIIKIVYNSF